MRYLMGTILSLAILTATASESKAQFGMSMGPTYYGSGIGIGNLGYTNGYGGGYGGFARPAVPGYYSGYNNFTTSAYVAGPGSLSYSSGYRGYAPPVAAYGNPYRGNPYGFANRPYYGTNSYGSYGYGSRNGFRAFRGVNSWLR